MDTLTLLNERIARTSGSIGQLMREREELKTLRDNSSQAKGIEKWRGYNFESSSTLTPEFAAFAKAYKKHISSILPEKAELVAFNRGHFYLSGFIKRGEKFVYFSMSDVRYSSGSWHDNILVRTATHEKDYTGGSNGWATLESFTKKVGEIF